MARKLRDAELRKTKAHPAAASTANSDFIDLGAVAPGVSLENIDVRIFSEALPSLVDAKTAILTIQDSADGVNGAAVAALATLIQTGAGGVGAAEAERVVKLPPNIRQYIRVTSAVLAAGGDNTAKNFGIELLF